MTWDYMPSEMPEIRQAAHLLIGIWGEGAATYARRRRAGEVDPVTRDIWERIVDEVERYLGQMAPPTYQ
jgi:hypothetical protein